MVVCVKSQWIPDKVRNIDVKPDLDYYTAFGFFRLASICQGVYARALKGQGQGSNSHIFRISFKLMNHGP